MCWLDLREGFLWLLIKLGHLDTVYALWNQSQIHTKALHVFALLGKAKQKLDETCISSAPTVLFTHKLDLGINVLKGNVLGLLVFSHTYIHCAKKPVTTMLTYPWKCTVLHCNHLGNTWKPLVLMTRHFDYCPSASEGDNQSVGSSAPVVSRCFTAGYNVKLYISRGRLAWWLLAF